MAFALVGAAGAGSQGSTNTAVTPAWGAGASRTAGNLLLLFISYAGSAAATPTISGWTSARGQTGTSVAAYIFYRIATGADAAPTVPAVASTVTSAHLEEWSGGATVSPVDQVGSTSGTSSPQTATLAAADAAVAELVAIAGSDFRSVARTTSDTWTSNHGTPTLQASNNAASSVNHYSHATLITNSKTGADTAVQTLSVTTSITGLVTVAVSFKPVVQNISAVGAIASAGAMGSGARLASGITAVGAIASAEAFGGYRSLILATPGLAGYWRLGEPSGTNAADQLGLNSGAYQNTPTLGVSGATAGNTGVTLNGTNQKVDIAHNARFNLGDVVTLEAWVNFGGSYPGSGGRGVISKGGGSYYVRLDGSNGQIQWLRSQIAVMVSSTVNVPATGWHHIVVTKNGATLKILLDKVDVTGSVSNSTLADNTNVLMIGADSFGAGSEFMTGSLDEAAVYSRDLTPTEVAAHYDAAPSLGGPNVSRSLTAVGAIASAEAFGTPVLSGTAVVVAAGAPFPYQGAGYYGG